jgi:hypothetical protein
MNIAEFRAERINNIGMSVFTKVEGNGLIGATGCYHIFSNAASAHEKLISPDRFTL